MSEKRRRLIIVGGVAGGATAAARARRLDEQAEIIVLERGPDVSFANCGLPYHIGGEIPHRNNLLVQTERGLEERFALDVRTGHEVRSVDTAARRVRVRDLSTGREYEESYDALLLSPGAQPIRPPVPGLDHPSLFTLRNLSDTDRLKQAVDAGARTALIVGGGFIGIEMAENLRRRGLEVGVVELLPQVLPPLDPEIANRVHQELAAHGVRLYLEDGVTGFEDADGRVRARLQSGALFEVDMVVLAVGVRPDTAFLKDSGLAMTERGALVVDEHMRTSDPHVYAVGDAVQVRDAVLGDPALVPLAGPANRQARIAVDNIFGRDTRYRGTQGTSILRVFDLTVGATGASEKLLRRRGTAYRKIYVHRPHHVSYFPGALPLSIKLLFAPENGRLLGAQVYGGAGVDKRVDVLATALQAGLTVTDLTEAELAYAPPYGAAKDPVNIAGYVADNLLRGDEVFVYAEDVTPETQHRWTLVDVRSPLEFDAGHIPGAKLLPLPELRTRLNELPKDKPVLTYCGVGQRAYYANRILRQHGYEACNLAGGFTTYRLVHAPRPEPPPWP